eukprot:6956833-Pyramimonas_sp.AAC.1
MEEDPCLTIITMPCGPWGDRGRCNISKGGAAAATVFEAQEATRPLLALSDQVVVDRVGRGRRVLSVYDQSEMKNTNKLIEDGVLVERTTRDCQLGYKGE